MTSQYVAYTVKGIEQIAAEEIKETISDADILSVGSKRIIFSSNKPLTILTKLKTIDDLQILLHSFTKPSTLDGVWNEIKGIDLLPTRKMIETFRNTSSNTFSITYGAVKTAYSKEEVIQRYKTYVENTYHWEYQEKDHTNFDIRIFCDEAACFLSVRLTKNSLQHRKYKQFEKPGSLRPTVAAALIRVTTKNTGGKIVDNFCGSGTILCEARIKNITVYGGDSDPESVTFTQKNLANINKVAENTIKILDATHTPWQTNFFDFAISNLPYGKQVPLVQITTLYEESLKEYIRITKNHGSICFLLTNPQLMEKYVKKYLPKAQTSTWQIGFTGQTPTILLIQKE